jgi:hypothetical protein
MTSATRPTGATVPIAPEPRSGRRVDRRVAVGLEYLAVAVASALAALVALRPWVAGWSTPIVHRNDALSVLAMTDAAGWTGTARGAAGLGAPHGTDWVDFPLGPDRLHLVVLRLVRLVVDDRLVAMSVYLVLGFVLVALAAHGVLRSLRVSPVVAGALAVVFSLSSYHLTRVGAGHVFLAAYVAVPLGVLLALWASDGSFAGTTTRHRRWWALIWILVVGSSSAYYAVFSIVLVVALGVVLAVRRWSWRALLAPAVIAASIGLVVVANVAGDLVTAAGRGANPEAVARPASDTDRLGLRAAALVMPPPTHAVPALADLGERYASSVPREGGSYLGVLGLAGLLVIVVRCVRWPGRGEPGRQAPALYPRLGVMTVASIGAATIGGGATLLAISGFGQIRVWDRMSVVLGVVALAGLAPAIDRLLAQRGASRTTTWIVAVALVGFALVDQVGGLAPDRQVNRDAVASDRQVAEGLQAMLAPGDSVLQFPWVAFPGGVTDQGMPMYAHLGPWATGDDSLRYSAGAIQGRGGDWQRSWLAQEPGVLAAGAAAAGFDALSVDRRAWPAPALQATPRSGTEMADALEDLGLPSDRSDDQSRQWFDLRPLRAQLVARLGDEEVAAIGRAVLRPIGVTFEGAASYTAAQPGERLLGPTSAITLRREDDETAPVRVRFLLSGEPGATVRLTGPGVDRRIRLDEDPVEVVLDVAMDAEEITLRLRTDAAELAGGDPDTDTRLGLRNLSVLDGGLDLSTLADTGE